MKNLLIVLSLMCSLCLQAKDGTIKYGKYVIYEGGIENKQPHGQGVLKLINPKTKGENDAEISGIFDGDNVSNARIISSSSLSNLPMIENISHLCINYGEQKGKCTSIDIIISNSTITSTIQNSAKEQIPSMKIDDLRLSFHITDNWILNYSNNLKGTYSPHKLPPILIKLQYSLDMVDYATEIFQFVVNKGGFLETAKVEIHGSSSPIYTMKNGIIVQDNKITYPNGSIVEVSDDSWSGSRTFSNGTKVSYDNWSKTLGFYRSNGDTYRGTIKGGIFYPLYANVNEPTFIIDTGTQIMNGVTTEWIKGETKENLRERLKNTLNEKWLAMVEDGKLSEDEAIKQQKEENDRIAEEKAKAAREKERQDVCAKIFREKWKCKEILFIGKLGEKNDGSIAFKAWMGVDHTYFGGSVSLVLLNNGNATLTITALPSAKGYRVDPTTAIIIGSACSDMIKDSQTGPWHLEGNRLFINGKKTSLILSSDYRTFKYDGLVGATLQIEKKI